MTTTTKRRRRPASKQEEPDINISAAEYEDINKAIGDLNKRKTALRTRLISFITKKGTEDEKGSLWFDLDDILPNGKGRIKYERRASQFLDTDEAEEFLEGKGLLKECQTTVTVFDESKLLNLYNDKKITEEELDALYKVNETWALKIL